MGQILSNYTTVPSRMRPDSKPEVPELAARVLRWTIDDITTSNLYKTQVQSFSSQRIRYSAV